MMVHIVTPLPGMAFGLPWCIRIFNPDSRDFESPLLLAIRDVFVARNVLSNRGMPELRGHHSDRTIHPVVPTRLGA